MAMITKTAPGSAEDMKYVKNAKNPYGLAKGGTQRTSFTGSSDSRKSGAIDKGPMGGMKLSPGYVDQAPIMMDPGGQGAMAASYTTGGPGSTSINKNVTPAQEDVTKGMGGKVIKNMK
tara:strand:- start:599 stop:952 length:354 start_codon:yes stop_codon:yes gene_type:complete